MNTITRNTLNFCNGVRAIGGFPLLERLPNGTPHKVKCCPIANALRPMQSYVSSSIELTRFPKDGIKALTAFASKRDIHLTLNGPLDTKRKFVEIDIGYPKYAESFIAAFDSGAISNKDLS